MTTTLADQLATASSQQRATIARRCGVSRQNLDAWQRTGFANAAGWCRRVVADVLDAAENGKTSMSGQPPRPGRPPERTPLAQAIADAPYETRMELARRCGLTVSTLKLAARTGWCPDEPMERRQIGVLLGVPPERLWPDAYSHSQEDPAGGDHHERLRRPSRAGHRRRDVQPEPATVGAQVRIVNAGATATDTPPGGEPRSSAAGPQSRDARDSDDACGSGFASGEAA
jgi:lambda repressor-like predicted transcriptional regulator